MSSVLMCVCVRILHCKQLRVLGPVFGTASIGTKIP